MRVARRCYGAGGRLNAAHRLAHNMVVDAEVRGESTDEEQPASRATALVRVLNLRPPVAAVPDLQPHEVIGQVEPDGELPARRYAVEQGVGRQLRDAELYVVDQGRELPLGEDIDDEIA